MRSEDAQILDEPRSLLAPDQLAPDQLAPVLSEPNAAMQLRFQWAIIAIKPLQRVPVRRERQRITRQIERSLNRRVLDSGPLTQLDEDVAYRIWTMRCSFKPWKRGGRHPGAFA